MSDFDFLQDSQEFAANAETLNSKPVHAAEALLDKQQLVRAQQIAQPENIRDGFKYALALDTETTGFSALPGSLIALSVSIWEIPETLAYVRKVAQFACRICHPEELETPVPQGALAVHGILREEARSTGFFASTPWLLELLKDFAKKSACIVCFNSEFDIQQLCENIPEISPVMSDLVSFDAMKMAGEFMDFRNAKGNKKNPKLREAYEVATGRPVSAIQHDASHDVEMTMEVFLWCLRQQAERELLQRQEAARLLAEQAAFTSDKEYPPNT